MGKLRVHNMAISIDGYGAGPNQDLGNPLGVGAERLHEWVFKTRYGRRMIGEEGGDEGLDDQFLARGDVGIGATIMGRNMFGPVRGRWPDKEWKGWWGPDPPYHHPVFVLTHHPREPIPMEGGTTFNFVTDGIESALSQAFAAAGDLDEAGRRLGDDPAVPEGRPCRRDACRDRANLPRRRRAPLRPPRRRPCRLRVRRDGQLAMGNPRALRPDLNSGSTCAGIQLR